MSKISINKLDGYTVSKGDGVSSISKSKWYIPKMKNMFKIEEERPTPKEVYNYRIYGTALVASFAAIIIGYDGGFIGGTVALDSFLKEFSLYNSPDKNYVVSNIISLFHAGCFFGALISYPFSFYFGRRITLIAAAALITAGSAIMLAASEKVGLGPIYAGRVLAGLSVGCSTNLTPVYLGEIAPPSIRGRIIAFYEIGWRIGDLVGFWINYGIDSHIPESKKQWFIPFAVQLIPSGMFLFGSVIMKESPRWLFSVNRDQEALTNLAWFRKLRADDQYVAFEVEQVKESLEIQREKIGLKLWDPFFEVFVNNRKLLIRLGITCMLFIFQNFMGIQSINYYSPTIFKSLGVKGTNATLFSTGIFGVVKFICTFISIFFVVDTFGRRVAFMWGSVICSLCFWYIGAYLKVNDPTVMPAGPGGTAAIVLIYIWIAAFIICWSAGPWVVGSEIFDQNIRSFVQSINAAVSWVPIFIMSRYTSNMIGVMHYGIYFFFATIAILSIPFVYFLLPETKGIALEDMDRLFDPKLSARRAHSIVMSRAQVEKTYEMNKNSTFHDNNDKLGKGGDIQYIEDVEESL